MVFELTGRPEEIDAFLKLMSRTIRSWAVPHRRHRPPERGRMHQHMQKPAREVREAQFPLPGSNKCH